MTGIIVFLASYLIWVILAFTLVLIGLDLWKGTNSRSSIWTRIKQANWRKVGYIVLAFLLSFLVAQLLHLLPVEYYRPYQIIMTAPLVTPSVDTPFPSDHVMCVFALAFAAIFMTRYKKIGLIGLVMAIGVAIGRVSALVHSPLDVWGGILCAVIGAAVWYYLYYRETPKNLPKDLKKLWKNIKELATIIGSDIASLFKKAKRR